MLSAGRWISDVVDMQRFIDVAGALVRNFAARAGSIDCGRSVATEESE